MEASIVYRGYLLGLYDARFLFKVWATGQWKIGECVIVFQFSGYMLSLSFLVSVLSFSNQKPCITNPMSILYMSPMTDKKTTHHIEIMENKMETAISGLGLKFGCSTLRGHPCSNFHPHKPEIPWHAWFDQLFVCLIPKGSM